MNSIIVTSPDHISQPPVDSGGGEPSRGYYVPGHRLTKLLMMLLGLIIFFGLAVPQLWPPLKMVCTGTRTTAQATRVIKSREGLPDVILNDDVQIRAALENHDRNYLFANELRFHTPLGQPVTVILPTRSQLKPLFALRDEDGLPTTVPVYFDPDHPEHVVFPAVFSTWFIPGMLAFIGLLCSAIGGVLALRAQKPIALPGGCAGKSDSFNE